MRLWHYKLISKLPRQQLLGQHRECCALRGLGWGKKHSVVDYVFKHPYYWLFLYHREVIEEMKIRNYNIDEKWLNSHYRGKRIGYDDSKFTKPNYNPSWSLVNFTNHLPNKIYPEHDEHYLKECVENLALKHIIL